MKYALIGEKLGHSLSKILHEKYFEIKGSNSSYDLIEIKKENFDLEFKKLLAKGYDGINVTIPYKKDVIPYLDYLSPEAEKIGAVNTIKPENGRLCGYNTDFFGIIKTFERYKIEIENKDVVILGTGGASAAVKTACLHLKAKSVVFVSRKRKIHDGILTKTYDDIISGDVLINATPVGMYPNIDACPIEKINFSAVFDLIYNPEKTLLLRRAAAEGKKAVNGLYMLVSQGIYAQSIWKKIPFEKEINEKVFDEVKKL